MNSPLPPPPEDDIVPIFVKIVLGFILALFLFGNLPWRLDNLDQAKQAYVSFEMIEDGSWLYQHTPAGRFASKPPLAGWISTVLYGLTGAGWWDGAWRVPSLVCGLLTLGLLWRAGFALFGNNIGALLAIAAFGLNSFTPRLATLVRTDMMLAFVTFLLGCVLLEKVRFRDPWEGKDKVLVCCLVFTAMMIKGPIIYIFFFPGFVLFFLLTRIWKIDWPCYAWSGWWPWLLPLVAFGAWIAGGISQHGDIFWNQVAVDEFFRRFETGNGSKHNTGWFGAYTIYLLGRWLPWSALLAGFLFVKEVRKALRADPTLLWVACWAFGGLIAMECVPSKRFDRILPIIPAFCILLPAAARHLPDFEWRDQPIGRLTVLVTLLASLGSVGYTAHRVISGYRDNLDALVQFGDRVHFVSKAEPHKLAVVSGGDEGLLLYTRRPQFTKIEDALELWNAGTIEWLVLPSDGAEGKEGVFEENRVSLIPFTALTEARRTPETRHGYVFLQRMEGPRRRIPPEVTETTRALRSPAPAPGSTPAPQATAPPEIPVISAIPETPPPLPPRATPLPVVETTPVPITPVPITPEPVRPAVRAPEATPARTSPPRTITPRPTPFGAMPPRAVPRRAATPVPRRAATPVPVRAAEPVRRSPRATTPRPGPRR